MRHIISASLAIALSGSPAAAEQHLYSTLSQDIAACTIDMWECYVIRAGQQVDVLWTEDGMVTFEYVVPSLDGSPGRLLVMWTPMRVGVLAPD